MKILTVSLLVVVAQVATGQYILQPNSTAYDKVTASPTPNPYGTPPVGYAPLPPGVAILQENIPAYEARAYAGSAKDAHALANHYGLILNDFEMQRYWLTIGAVNGSPKSLAMLSFRIADVKEPEQKETLLRLAQWSWQKYSSQWTKEDKEYIIGLYEEKKVIVPFTKSYK